MNDGDALMADISREELKLAQLVKEYRDFEKSRDAAMAARGVHP